MDILVVLEGPNAQVVGLSVQLSIISMDHLPKPPDNWALGTLGCDNQKNRGFLKIWATFLGVPVVRVIVMVLRGSLFREITN